MWVQGIVTGIYEVEPRHIVVIDDGTGIIYASVQQLEPDSSLIDLGSYVFVQGSLLLLIDLICFNSGAVVSSIINVRSAGLLDNCNTETFLDIIVVR